MKKPLFLYKLTASKFWQETLEKWIYTLLHLMGIGTGTEASFSGESSVIGLLRRKQNEDFCIFDVGANKGQYSTMLLNNLTNEKIKVHCFEPSKVTYNILMGCHFPAHFKLNNMGLGKSPGVLDLFYNEEGSGLASLTKRKLDHFNISFNMKESVNIDTIDNYCAKHNIERIHLLKIDVEGHELDVLQGAENMLKENRIDMITFEFGGCNIDSRTFFQDFWRFLKTYNMSIYRITPTGFLNKLDEYKETYEQFITTNYLAKL